MKIPRKHHTGTIYVPDTVDVTLIEEFLEEFEEITHIGISESEDEDETGS